MLLYFENKKGVKKKGYQQVLPRAKLLLREMYDVLVALDVRCVKNVAFLLWIIRRRYD